jgi:hypothetical protein
MILEVKNVKCSKCDTENKAYVKIHCEEVAILCSSCETELAVFNTEK